MRKAFLVSIHGTRKPDANERIETAASFWDVANTTEHINDGEGYAYSDSAYIMAQRDYEADVLNAAFSF